MNLQIEYSEEPSERSKKSTMSLVPYDKELEALEEEERQLDLEIAKQEKSREIAAKRRKLEELSSAGSGSTAAVPTVTRTATLTVKTSKVRYVS